MRECYFTREETLHIKGIALIMMFLHHFFTFPSWWEEGISYPHLAKLAPYLSEPMRMCVPVFCFITGYLYFFNDNKTFGYSFRKITDVLVHYWTVFILFALAAVACGYRYGARELFLEAFSLVRPTMVFCWYVSFYCLMMLVFPVIRRIVGHNIFFDLMLIALTSFLFRLLPRYIPFSTVQEVFINLSDWFPIALSGYIFARYGLFEKLGELDRRMIRSGAANVIVWLLAALLLPLGRFAVYNATIAFGISPALRIGLATSVSMDIVYAPLFIYAVVNLCRAFKFRYLRMALAQIGKYSLTMWFVSCIFFGNVKAVFQPILYLPRDPILVTLWGLLLCYGVSLPLEALAGRINGYKNRVLAQCHRTRQRAKVLYPPAERRSRARKQPPFPFTLPCVCQSLA